VSQSASATAMVLSGPEHLEQRQFPLPATGPDDGLLRVEACGICGTDYDQFYARIPGLRTALPIIPGHEVVGRITAVGERAADRWGVSVGDRVAVPCIIPCGACYACAAGEACIERRVYGVSMGIDDAPALWGGFADYMYLDPSSELCRVPDGIDAADASLFQPLANGIKWAAEIPGTKAGDTVAVLGPGQQGLGCVAAAKQAGAVQIIVVGRSSDVRRLAAARALGATATIDADVSDPVATILELTAGTGADTVVDVTARATEPVSYALDIARPYGQIVLAGLKGHAEIPGFVSDKIVQKRLRISGVSGAGRRQIELALRLIAEHASELRMLRTHTFPVSEAEHAIRLAGREIPGEDPIHVTLVSP
jgi:threonine dehydrogenase-like Zn-dependent dehydrogenase